MSGRGSFRVDAVNQEDQGSGSVALPSSWFPLQECSMVSQRPFLIQPSVKAGRRARFFLLHISEARRKTFSWSCLADIFLCLIEDNCQIPFPKPITCRGNGIPIIGLNQSSFILWAGNIAPLHLNYLNKTGD